MPNDYKVDIYDQDLEKYVSYSYCNQDPLPVYGVSILQKLKLNISNDTCRKCITNMPPKGTILSSTKSKNTPYLNIRTAILKQLSPQLVIQYSNKQLAFSGKRNHYAS